MNIQKTILLNKCPICGGTLFTDELNQYSIERDITKDGKVSKKYRKVDQGSMECCAVFCKNGDFKTNYEMRIIEPWSIKGKIYIDDDDKVYLITEE